MFPASAFMLLDDSPFMELSVKCLEFFIFDRNVILHFEREGIIKYYFSFVFYGVKEKRFSTPNIQDSFMFPFSQFACAFDGLCAISASKYVWFTLLLILCFELKHLYLVLSVFLYVCLSLKNY